MANISNIVTTTLLPQGASAAVDNMNVVCVMTSEQSVLTSADRFRAYTSAADAQADWGSASEVTAYANTFFGTVPNAVQAGGRFIVGYFRKAEEVTAATAGEIRGGQVNASTVISQLQGITDGSFSITVDAGAAGDLTAMDFSAVATMTQLLAVIQAKLSTGSTISFTSDNRFLITSATTGATSAISLLTEAAEGTFLGSILALSAGTGVVKTDGLASDTLAAEAEIAALAAVKAEVNFKGVCFIDAIADAKVPDVAAWGVANDVLVYCVFSGSTYLALGSSNPVWVNKLAGRKQFRTLYRADGDRKFACTYMARAHTVNFAAENGAMTMQSKALNISSEGLTQSVMDSAKTVGLDVYVAIKNTPVVLTSGANDFVDNVYNLSAYVDAVQTAMFNAISGTSTKLAQTEPDVDYLLSVGEKVTRQFVRAGFIAPGTWLLNDTFGNAAAFRRNIEQFGFFWNAGALSDQSVSDRDLRKSPPLQVAIKYAGAMHSADVIIQFNR